MKKTNGDMSKSLKIIFANRSYLLIR